MIFVEILSTTGGRSDFLPRESRLDGTRRSTREDLIPSSGAWGTAMGHPS